jgi:hypothetical protein
LRKDTGAFLGVQSLSNWKVNTETVSFLPVTTIVESA